MTKDSRIAAYDYENQQEVDSRSTSTSDVDEEIKAELDDDVTALPTAVFEKTPTPSFLETRTSTSAARHVITDVEKGIEGIGTSADAGRYAQSEVATDAEAIDCYNIVCSCVSRRKEWRCDAETTSNWGSSGPWVSELRFIAYRVDNTGA